MEEATADKPLVVTDCPEIVGFESVTNPFTIKISSIAVTGIDAGKSMTIESDTSTSELTLNYKYPLLMAFTSQSSTTNEGLDRLIAVIPDILFPVHLSIDLPSFLLAIVMDPCGYVVGGFRIVPIEN